MNRLLRRPDFIIGFTIIAFFTLLAISADAIVDPESIMIGDREDILLPPSPEHPLGTDILGRDILGQVIMGSRVSIIVGVSAAFISIVIGVLVGVVSGYLGGLVDETLMRLTDAVMVMPTLPLMIVFSAVLGGDLINLIIVISIVGWPYSARIIRSQVLSLKERLYIYAAKAVGASPARIIFRHILPNTFPIALAEAVLYISTAIYSEAVISFLGLGDPFLLSWGTILNNAFQSGSILTAWWWILSPGLAISLLILGFTLLGNSIYETYGFRSTHL